MTSFGVISLGQVRAILAACAAEHTWKARTHNILVTYNGIAFPTLSIGAHGKHRGGDLAEVKIGEARKMFRRFNVLECAKRHSDLI